MAAHGLRHYSVPTPACHLSYGLDHEMKVRPSEFLMVRRQKVLLDRAIVRPPPQQYTWPRNELLEVDDHCRPCPHNNHHTAAAAKQRRRRPPVVPTVSPPRGCLVDVGDPSSHECPWQTRTESQNIGWFADPRRLPPCRVREWPQNYSFV